MQKRGHVIDGEEVASLSGKTFLSINPANEETIAEVADGRAEDVALAVHSARKAFHEGPWRTMPPWERGRILHEVAELIRQKTDHLRC